MAHGSHGDISERLENAESKVQIGGRYRHYKSTEKTYEVVGLGVLEADERIAVLYRIANGATPHFTWIRPLESFCSTVEHEGRTVPRFAKIA